MAPGMPRLGPGFQLCEGGVDVVGVVTPLRGVVQVVLHGIQVVEVGVRLRVHQDGEVEEAGQQQVVKEGQSGWVFQAVFSRAFFRRIPRNGKSYFTMMSLHINKQLCQETRNR